MVTSLRMGGTLISKNVNIHRLVAELPHRTYPTIGTWDILGPSSYGDLRPLRALICDHIEMRYDAMIIVISYSVTMPL